MNSKQQAKSDRQRHARFSGTVKELAAPGVTFGYIGKCERWGDDRLFAIFLPHPGRARACRPCPPPVSRRLEARIL
jgi:hypothetical protein